MFPEGEKRRAVSHRRRDAVVLPRHRSLRRDDRRSRSRCALLLSDAAATSSTTTCAARASASASIRATACCAQGARGLSAHLDGREGRRLGRDAAPRQGGRDQRALVQRAAADGALGCARTATTPARDRTAHADAARSDRSTSASGTTTAAISTTSSTARAAATIRRCRPEPGVRDLAADIRCSTRERWEPVLRRRARAAADAGRPALARAGRSRLQAAVLRRPARARRRLSPGHGLGAG